MMQPYKSQTQPSDAPNLKESPCTREHRHLNAEHVETTTPINVIQND